MPYALHMACPPSTKQPVQDRASHHLSPRSRFGLYLNSHYPRRRRRVRDPKVGETVRLARYMRTCFKDPDGIVPNHDGRKPRDDSHELDEPRE